MPIAAVPDYLRKEDEQFYLHAPPGHRFSLYFPVWGLDAKPGATARWMLNEVALERKKGRNGEPDKWESRKVENKHWACTVAAGRKPDEGPDLKRHLVSKNDDGLDKWRDLLRSLRQRQTEVLKHLEAVFAADAVAVAPFTTGLGNEHPLENGFAFLNPYGLPYLPGSGVKGVARRAARELAEGKWENDRGWRGLDKPCYRLEFRHGKQSITVPLSVLDVLFGRESGSGDTEHVRGALAFWDVIPQVAGDSLMVEIMTPHQSHYYQQKRDRKSGDSITPHDSGQPNPICFLTVPPGSRFAFHVVCDTAHLARLTKDKGDGAPDLLAMADGRPLWQTLLVGAFEHAFEWLGFGAKTAVGYGAMRERSPSPAEGPGAATSSAQAAAAKTVVWQTAKLVWNRGSQELSAVSGSERTAPVKGVEKARALFADPAIFDRLLKKGEHGPARVEVAKEGNYIELKRVL